MSRETAVAFSAGEREAFRRLFDAFGQQVFAVVRRYFRNAFDQEEAFQEVWLQLYRARRAFDVDRHEAFGSWARQVARNRCLDLLKARRRAREVPLSEGEPSRADDRAVQEADQVGAVVDGRVRELLNRFVAQLGDEQRRFFGCCFVDELGHDEIALRLGISVRRSKYLKKKLLAQLVACAGLREVGRS